MKRGGPLQRRTRLAPGAGPQRRTELRQVSPAPAKAARRSTRRPDTGPSEKVRAKVKARDKGCCVVCGVTVDADYSIHHRRNRGPGGSKSPLINLPSNLLLVCGSGTTRCHGDLTDNRDRPEALAAGWVVSLNAKHTPASIPVKHAIHGLVRLEDDGSYAVVGSAAA